MVISEVMYHPLATSAPDEFVELVNLSADTVDLAGWRLADRFSTDDLVGDDLLLGPGQTAVIFEADYDTLSGTYAGSLPAGVLVLSVDDFSIGNGLANSGDSLFLIDPDNQRVDSTGWDGDMDPGYSLEKVILDDCVRPDNWRKSTQLHGTPGSGNSVAGSVVDLALDLLSWQLVASPRNFDITVAISNLGLEAAGGQLLAKDSVVADVSPLLSGESRDVAFNWAAPPGSFGRQSLVVRIVTAGDYDTTNNALEVFVLVPVPPMALVVNEIMYTPLEGEPEWVELVNTTAGTINLGGWAVDDLNSSALLPEESVGPGEYVLATSDSVLPPAWPAGIRLLTVPGFPALNNDGDEVVLRDAWGQAIDRVDYRPFPLTPRGRSLEKVSPTALSEAASSWVISPADQGHTAGRPNSVQLPTAQTHISLEPNPLPLNRTTSILVVEYITPYPAVNLVVEIYDLAGRRLTTLFNEGPVPGSGAVTWDARSVDPVRFRTGQYVLLFRARDTSSRGSWERMERLVLMR